MAFTMPQYPLLSGQQASPFADLMKNALSNYQQALRAKYEPRMLEADIFGKQFAPLAQIASSPLALAMLPDQRQQMAALISQLLQRSGAATGQGGGMQMGLGNAPAMNQALSGGINSSNAQGAPPQGTPEYARWVNGQPGSGIGQSGNPNLPSFALQQGAEQKVTAPYAEQLHPPGSAYTTQSGNPMVASSSDIVSKAQSQINAMDIIAKEAPDLVNMAKEFAKKGGTLGLAGSSIAALGNRMGLPSDLTSIISDDPDKAGRYNTFQAKKERLVGILKNIYPEPQALATVERYSNSLDLRPTDTEKTYASRVKSVINEINRTARPVALKAMGAKGGYSLENIPKENGLPNSNKVAEKLRNSKSARDEGIAEVNINSPGKPENVKADKNGNLYHKIKGKWYPVIGEQ